MGLHIIALNWAKEIRPPKRRSISHETLDSDSWDEAQAVMGEIPAAIVVAAILQRGEAIMSAGGYLRELTRKAEAGEFTLGPMLMALIGARKREKKRA